MAKSNEHEEVENIRGELRELKVSERKCLREKLFERKRFTLGELGSINKNFNPEDVSSLAKELKKKALNVDRYQDLQNALLQCEENINAFLSVDNIIHSLVRDLSGNNPQIQLVAAGCCCNIALGNSKACMSIAKNCIPYLVTEMDSMNYPLVEVCVWTIGNLVSGNRKVIGILIAQDFFKSLVKLMNHCNDNVRSSVIYTSIRCLYVGHREIQNDDKVDMIKEVNKFATTVEDVEDLWLLALLSSHPGCMEYLIRYAPSAIDCLNETFNDNDHDVIQLTAILRLVSNLISQTSGQVAGLFLNNPSLSAESLLNGLLLHSYVHIRKETLCLIGNMYNHPNHFVRLHMNEMVPRLINMTLAVAAIEVATR